MYVPYSFPNLQSDCEVKRSLQQQTVEVENWNRGKSLQDNDAYPAVLMNEQGE
jgi:hypothetical protein